MVPTVLSTVGPVQWHTLGAQKRAEIRLLEVAVSGLNLLHQSTSDGEEDDESRPDVAA